MCPHSFAGSFLSALYCHVYRKFWFRSWGGGGGGDLHPEGDCKLGVPQTEPRVISIVKCCKGGWREGEGRGGEGREGGEEGGWRGEGEVEGREVDGRGGGEAGGEGGGRRGGRQEGREAGGEDRTGRGEGERE